jgi:hypothetical protein
MNASFRLKAKSNLYILKSVAALAQSAARHRCGRDFIFHFYSLIL